MRNTQKKKNKEIKSENDAISWKIPEYVNHKKNKRWYMMAIMAAALFLVYSLFTANFLFAIIVVIAAVIIILRHGEKINLLDVIISDNGVTVGKNYYEYAEFKNFSIVYKPREKIKNLYFEFKSILRPRLSVSLKEENPLLIRKNLLKYLEEDTERTDIPLSEQLAKLFRL